jgi:hypothetical protein
MVGVFAVSCLGRSERDCRRLTASGVSAQALIRELAIQLAELTHRWVDPVAFTKMCWPWVTLYDKQREMLYSVEFNKSTYVKSANMMGKDFIAGILIVKNFVCHPEVRILGTSVTDAQLGVLRSEVNRFIETSKVPLLKKHGGLLDVNYNGVTKLLPDKSGEDKTSYVKFMTTSTGEALAGHHAEWTLLVADEASGLTKQVKTFTEGWAKKDFIFGNPHECQNFWREGCDQGDILDDSGETYLRKIIDINCYDSPNVRAGIAKEKLGLPVGDDVIKGVLSYGEFKFRMKMWDDIRKCVGLFAKFYVGKELRLYPPAWINASHEFLKLMNMSMQAKALGVDPAEGGDNTSMSVVNDFGLLELQSFKTTDTSVISGHVLAMARKWNCPTSAICFDRGGGGKQIADRMKADGYPVTTVAFGEAVNLDIKRVRHQVPDRRENREDKTIYTSRRQEMYAILSDAIDPAWLTDFDGKPVPGKTLFALPRADKGPEYAELLRQMSLVPKLYDEKGRLAIPPKRKKPGAKEGDQKAVKTLEEIMGCSPDELDSLAIAYWRMTNKPPVQQAGAMV